MCHMQRRRSWGGGGGGGQTYIVLPPNNSDTWKIHNMKCKNMFKKHNKTIKFNIKNSTKHNTIFNIAHRACWNFLNFPYFCPPPPPNPKSGSTPLLTWIRFSEIWVHPWVTNWLIVADLCNIGALMGCNFLFIRISANWAYWWWVANVQIFIKKKHMKWCSHGSYLIISSDTPLPDSRVSTPPPPPHPGSLKTTLEAYKRHLKRIRQIQWTLYGDFFLTGAIFITSEYVKSMYKITMHCRLVEVIWHYICQHSIEITTEL